MLESLDALKQDTEFAIRGLGRSPGFTATIILSMALGVGGNIAIIAVLDRLLFQSPAGVEAPGQLRRLAAVEQMPGRAPYDWTVFSLPDAKDLGAAIQDLGNVEGYTLIRDQILGDDGPHVTISHVTSGFLPMLGMRPSRGRSFTPDENALQLQVVSPAVMSFDLWSRAFGADTAIVGQRLVVSGQSVVVVGVGPQGFQGLEVDPVDLWLPLGARIAPGSETWINNRDARFLSLVVRLRASRPLSAVLTRLSTTYERAHAESPIASASARVTSMPLLQARTPGELSPLQERGMSLAKRLMAVALSVLAVTTVNVGMLLLMRLIRRRNEMAVRLALGMSRRRMTAQLFVESLVLAVIAGSMAVLVGWWGSALLRRTLLSTIHWPASAIDSRIIVTAAVLAAGVGLSAGLVPAWAARRYDGNVMRTDATSVDPTGRRARTTLLAVQTALCVILIVFAGAFLQSMRRVGITNLGFDADRLIGLVGRIGASAETEDVAKAVQALPFITSMANATSELAPDRQRGAFATADGPVPDALAPSFNVVGPTYFETVGLKMVRGRALSARDAAGAEPVVVITESMARAFWPRRDPVGECVFILGNRGTCRRVVGVVEDVRWQLSSPPILHYYVALAQMRSPAGRNWYFRTAAPPTAEQMAEVDRLVRSMADPLSRPRISRVSTLLEPQLAPLRGASALLLAFGALALFLAATGAYGLMTSEISHRTRELGIRIALGASTREVARLVLASGVRAIGVGIGAGLAGSVVFGRIISAFLFDTAPYDPTVFVLVVVTISGASFAAMLPAALTAGRLDPAMALRHD